MIKLTNKYQLINGDSLSLLKQIPDQSIDSVVTDPPYPFIKRSYGSWNEEQWNELMDTTIVEIRRVLKPKGSAIFILQPNHETPGKVRPWMFKFIAKYIELWNMPQDIWWFNPTAMPTTHCSREYGLMRPAVKACVWLGPIDCYKNQDAILWTSSFLNKNNDLEDRALKRYPSGSSMRRGRCIQTSIDRGGSTPFNFFPIGSGSKKRKGSKHGATTPLELCEQLVKYITPPNGIVLDPFSGIGTVGVAALRNGFQYIGIEKNKEYHDEAEKYIDEFVQEQKAQLTLFEV
jgi:DNA modification methylase